MRQGRDSWVAIPLILGAFVYLVWSHLNEPWPVMRVAAICMIGVGAALWALARIQLGPSFSVSAKATALVTNGLYSRIRNPIYVFGSIVIAGLCLFFERPIFLLVLLVIVPLQIVRARKEAEVLEAAFGDAYREYHAKTWI
ncbi:MAG: isoprenylcysteine carboxylmethyltransferase family protein [Candidatus Acidiferrales bacterium]